METIINIFYAIANFCFGVAFVSGVIILIAFAYLLAKQDKAKQVKDESKELTFKGPSRAELEITTAKLLQNDRRRYRRRGMR